MSASNRWPYISRISCACPDVKSWEAGIPNGKLAGKNAKFKSVFLKHLKHCTDKNICDTCVVWEGTHYIFGQLFPADQFYWFPVDHCTQAKFDWLDYRKI